MTVKLQNVKMPQRTPSASPVRHYTKLNRASRNRPYGAVELNQHSDKIDRGLDDRSYPRRDVVHYESPPRRRLRETEDEAVKVYHESKYLEYNFVNGENFANFFVNFDLNRSPINE